MKPQISIRRVWNTPDDRAAVDALTEGFYIRRRGRGYREGRRQYWQSLPIKKAAYLTYYLDPRENYREKEVVVDPYGGSHCDNCGSVGSGYSNGKVCRECGRGIYTTKTAWRMVRDWSAPGVGFYYEYRGIDKSTGKPRIRECDPGSRGRWL